MIVRHHQRLQQETLLHSITREKQVLIPLCFSGVLYNKKYQLYNNKVPFIAFSTSQFEPCEQ